MVEVRVEHAVKADGVFKGSVAGVGAIGAVVELGGPGSVHEGVVVEVLRFAAALLPDEQARVPVSNISHFVAHKGQRLIPRGLAPLSRHAFLVGAN